MFMSPNSPRRNRNQRQQREQQFHDDDRQHLEDLVEHSSSAHIFLEEGRRTTEQIERIDASRARRREQGVEETDPFILFVVLGIVILDFFFTRQLATTVGGEFLGWAAVTASIAFPLSIIALEAFIGSKTADAWKRWNADEDVSPATLAAGTALSAMVALSVPAFSAATQVADGRSVVDPLVLGVLMLNLGAHAGMVLWGGTHLQRLLTGLPENLAYRRAHSSRNRSREDMLGVEEETRNTVLGFFDNRAQALAAGVNLDPPFIDELARQWANYCARREVFPSPGGATGRMPPNPFEPGPDDGPAGSLPVGPGPSAPGGSSSNRHEGGDAPGLVTSGVVDRANRARIARDDSELI